jgi:predicted glycosyltransferase
VDYLKLPSIAKVANEQYRARSLQLNEKEIIGLRSAILEAALQAFRPDVLLIDRYPLGIHDELRGGLERLRSQNPQARIVLGLRDILDDADTIRSEWRRHGYTDAIEQLYDQVLVYGDRSVYDALAEYRVHPSIARRAIFTGYLAEALVTKPPSRVRARLGANGAILAICALGGGEDGAPVAWAFLEAIRKLSRRGWTGILVTGPFMPEDEAQELRVAARSASCRVKSFVEDLPDYLNAADVVVTMGGYNTLCEVLALAARCVVVPRVLPRSEQLIRARLMAERGIVELVPQGELTPECLRVAMVEQSQIPREEIRSRIRGIAVNGIGVAVEAIVGPATSSRREGATRFSA